MDKKEILSKIKIVSSDEKLNQKIEQLLRHPHDCFGDFNGELQPCKDCLILSEVDERREPLSTFCKEATLVKKEKKAKKVEESVVKVKSEEEKDEEKEELLEQGGDKMEEEKNGNGTGKGKIGPPEPFKKWPEFIKAKSQEGKSKDEVKQMIFDHYVSSGNEAGFAKIRSSFWVNKEYPK